MAPTARRDCADTSFGVNTKLGPRNRTSSFRILMVSIGVIFNHIPPLLNVASF